MRILLSTLFLSACGSYDLGDWQRVPKQDDMPINIEEPVESIRKIRDEFLNDCETKYGADTSNAGKIEFIRYGIAASKESPDIIGFCMQWFFDSGELEKAHIIVEKQSSLIKMKAVLYHELGHCVLGLNHTEQEPKTIMSPQMHHELYYQENWDQLVKDMCLRYSE